MINLLLRQSRMTIAQLVEATGVTTTAIRQQVDRLVSEGWLAREGRAEAWADRDTFCRLPSIGSARDIRPDRDTSYNEW